MKILSAYGTMIFTTGGLTFVEVS